MKENHREGLKRVIVLGNCAAERLRFMLEQYSGFSAAFQMAPAPMIHAVKEPSELRALADLALSCDVIFTQPLFNFGPCNTMALREALGEDAYCAQKDRISGPEDSHASSASYGLGGRRLFIFSSPDFDAYFPDAIYLSHKENLRLPQVLDWDSSIIFSCFCQGASIFEVEEIYLNHPMFKAEAVGQRVAQGLERYALREQGLDIGSQAFFFKNYAAAKLLHSPRHPVDDFLFVLLRGMAGALGLEPNASLPPLGGFGFNQWPVITRHYPRFKFAEQAWFVVAGKKYGIEDVAMAYYNFYEFNPHVVEANQDKIIALS